MELRVLNRITETFWLFFLNVPVKRNSSVYNVICADVHIYLSINARFEKGKALKDARNAFLPTFFPRLYAAFCVLLLIGTCSLTGVLGLAFAVPALSHGTHVDHASGQIVVVGPGKDFILLTATGQRLVFQCGDQCRASLAHMQRHEREHAHTDVYYIEGAGRTLMALDVD